ncbi:MAG: transporter substrate-binding domain-containing protein [bacterium]
MTADVDSLRGHLARLLAGANVRPRRSVEATTHHFAGGVMQQLQGPGAAIRRGAWLLIVWMSSSAIVHAQSRPGARALEIAVEDEADPWSRKDGSGYVNDLVRAAFAAAGVDVTLLVMPYARCKQMAIRGTLPACASMSANVLKPDPVTFSATPLFVASSDYFERSDRSLHARSASELPRGTVVGVVLGYEYPASIYRLSRDSIIVLDYSASETINLHKLVAGRIDAAMVNYDFLKTVDYVVESAGVKGKVRKLFSAGTLPAYIGFSQKNEQASWAADRYAKGVAIIAANGTSARIRDAWAMRVNAHLAAQRAKAQKRVLPK